MIPGGWAYGDYVGFDREKTTGGPITFHVSKWSDSAVSPHPLEGRLTMRDGSPIPDGWRCGVVAGAGDGGRVRVWSAGNGMFDVTLPPRTDRAAHHVVG